MKISVVSTLYRSERFIEEFCRRVSREVGKAYDNYEIVLVNDGSPDRSLEVAKAVASINPKVRVVDLTRNFGHHRAILAGLSISDGDVVFLIDSDLEEEPELFSSLMQELKRMKADVVYGVQTLRKGGLFERISGAAFYSLFNLLSDLPIPRNLSTVRVMTREFVKSVLLHDERAVFLPGIFVAAGFVQVPFQFQKHSKIESAYSLKRKVSMLVDSITSFSSKPLNLIFYMGAAIFFVSAILIIALITARLFFFEFAIGWPSLLVSIWALGGLTIFCIGLVGMYISRVITEVKRRPNYIVRDDRR